MITSDKYLSDEELLGNFYKSQDNYWLGMLLQRYSLLMLGVCMKYLNNEEEAKDATQEIVTFLLTDLKCHKVNYFKSWLFSVTKNHCLVRLRKNKNIIMIDEAHEAADESHIELITEKEKTYQQLEHSMQELTEEQHVCIRLFFYENKAYKEIEEITGYDSKKVKSYIQNGKRNLKLSLDKKRLDQNG